MSQSTRFTSLMKPGRIGQMDIRNRIVMAPMCTSFASSQGYVTDRLTDYYEERARGGVGLVIVAAVCIDHPRGRTEHDQLGISRNEFVPGLLGLAEVLHKHGAKAAIQLHHGGRYSQSDVNDGFQPVAPSPIPLMPGADVPKELTIEEIKTLVKLYGEAAARAKAAGFDGVEIHGAHGYLINEFLSRSANKRNDIYGGDLRNRARLLLGVIAAIREHVGADYPVWCRLNGSEFEIENGNSIEDNREIASMAEKAGVDAIHVTGHAGSLGVAFTKAPLVHTPGALLPLASGIKRSVKVPVIAVGRITLEAGEKAIHEGQADFVAMGRALIADPELPAKAASGNEKDIRHCIHCYTCVGQNFKRESLCCAINAAVGREKTFRLEASGHPSKVVVVGGGPAGMEAARLAALKGHRVTIYDKEHRLGGSLFFAAVARSDNELLTNYLSRQIKRLGVETILGKEMSPTELKAGNPEALIVASGGRYPALSIKGIDSRNVRGSKEMREMISGRLNDETAKKIAAWQRPLFQLGGPVMRRFLSPALIRSLTRFWMPIGRNVVVIGGDLVGCELAGFLAERGRKVTVLESTKKIAPELPLPMKWILLDHLGHVGVELLTLVKYEEITPGSVVVTTKDGQKQTIKAETVIIAAGIEPNPDFFRAVEGKFQQVYIAGDSGQSGLIRGAISSGADAALKIQ